MKKYEVLVDDNDKSYLRLLEDYPGVCIRLGEVIFSGGDTDEDPATMHYHYDITEGRETVKNLSLFEKYIGDLLVESITTQLEKNELVFTGGKDS